MSGSGHKVAPKLELYDTEEMDIKPKKFTAGFGDWLFDDSFADVKIMSSDGKSYRAHRVILANESHVLRQMFDPNNAEDVIVVRRSSAAVKAILTFIYKGFFELDILQLDTASEVLELAKSFKVFNLHLQVENQLSHRIANDGLSADNFLEVHRFAEKNNFEESVKVIVAFGFQNKKAIMNRELMVFESPARVKQVLRLVMASPIDLVSCLTPDMVAKHSADNFERLINIDKCSLSELYALKKSGLFADTIDDTIETRVTGIAALLNP